MAEEANEFLSKLKQRAGRGKGKRQGKEKFKKGGGTKESVVESCTKHTTPTKRSPRRKQENRVGMSPAPSNVRASPKGCHPRSNSSMELSPRGFQSCSDSPIRGSPGSFQPHSALPMEQSPRGIQDYKESTMRGSPKGVGSPTASPIFTQEGCVSDPVVVDNSPPLSPVLVRPHHDSSQSSEIKTKKQEKKTSPRVTDFFGRDSLIQRLDFSDPGDVEVVETCADKTDVNVYGSLGLSTTSSPRDVMSPPVPSPDYSFMDPVSPPGSPTPCASPLPQKIVLSPDPASPCLPVDSKSPVSERGLDVCPLSNSPVSPSVCSFSSQIASAGTKDKREDLVRNLDLKHGFNDRETAEVVEVKEFDPTVPLMERIRAARDGRQIFKPKDVDELEGSSDTNDNDEIESRSKKSPKVSSQQEKDSNPALEIKEVENIPVDEDFDFYDDGGYNFDIEELNNLDNCLESEDDNFKPNIPVEERGESRSNKNELLSQEKGAKVVADKRKIPQRQRSVEDGKDTAKPPDVPKKRGKKTDSQSSKPVEQTVTQPVTPMPNYHDMATPVLKVCHIVSVVPLRLSVLQSDASQPFNRDTEGRGLHTSVRIT